jgi:hypothetical protein
MSTRFHKITNQYAWWLPKGSIRALLALIVVSATTWVLAVNSEYGVLAGLAIVVINFYFLKDSIGVTASDTVNVSAPIDPVEPAE